MVALEVVVIDEFTQRPAQRGFAEQDEFGQTLLFYRPHPPFGERVGQGSQLQRMATAAVQPLRSSIHIIH